MTISEEPPSQLLKGCERPEDLLGDAGLINEFKIRLMERMQETALTAHRLPDRALRRDVPSIRFGQAGYFS